MIFVVVKKVKTVDLEKAKSVDSRKDNHVDIEAIRERLSKRFGKDIGHHASSIAAAAAAAPSGNNDKQDLRTLKQKLSEKFKQFQVPTLCGVRSRKITTFRPREIAD